eukprot:CAMPEP_0177257474 /NCGR_PEP_ID=MMETSP0367-20130122/57560_1 /TAXON_ID=447022 ORGANISM="Scrippsiella hangoei-like, Strain SHHI-4" /NCGR_SAMPLE_ID=MMETSP0367 /ASSEMBLY_ACC=CAM_ASM_000362 /LENGTH=30 /DNA_ID= /DNA_START= /DNA_END= /DNA_ORIENTATION=
MIRIVCTWIGLEKEAAAVNGGKRLACADMR